MLPGLYVAHHEGRHVSVGDLCLFASAPQTTGLRHVEKLEETGFLTRVPDQRDARRCWVRPTDKALNGMTALMEEYAAGA